MFRAAATLGLLSAKFNFAQCLFDGIGVESNQSKDDFALAEEYVNNLSKYVRKSMKRAVKLMLHKSFILTTLNLESE